MANKEQLVSIRKEIDGIDNELVALFKKRMDLADNVAVLKREQNISITDISREQEIIERVVQLAGDQLSGEAVLFMRSVLALSKERQRKKLFDSDMVLLPSAKEPSGGNINCAFFGVPGAWTEQALLKLYPECTAKDMEYCEDVFKAVKSKETVYGVLPIENSQTGAIGEVYDLLREYGCYIVGQTQLGVNHCLIANESVKLTDIREVYSHPQGFSQCHNFLKDRAWDLTACRNTAVAAQKVAELNDKRSAAIGSRRAAELCGLSIIAPDIMDSAANKTRFVVIALEPEYDDSCDIVSITFSTAHRSGALCEALIPFMASGVNLSRIESRPSSGGKYRFFADLQGNIQNETVCAAIRQASSACEYLEVIGCYKEK